MTTRRTTFTRTPFVITAFLAANLAVTGTPLVAMAEEGVPQENPPAAEQQPEQAPEQLQTQQAPEPNLETQATTIPYEVDTEGKTLTITGDLAAGCWDGSTPQWGSLDKTKIETVNIKESAKPKAYNCENLFVDFTNLTSVNLTGLDVSKATSFVDMFKNCNKLKELTLPQGFRFNKDQNPGLIDPSDTLMKWSNGTNARSAEDLVKLYTKDEEESPSGDFTWKWQEKITVSATMDVPKSVVYNGEAQEPATVNVQYTREGEKQAQEMPKTDCTTTITYSNNTHAGQATVSYELTDPHDGEGYFVWGSTTGEMAKFTIEQRPINFRINDVTMVYDGYKEPKDIRAKIKYTVTYDQDDIVKKDKNEVQVEGSDKTKWVPKFTIAPSCSTEGEAPRSVGTYKMKINDVTLGSGETDAEDGLTASADDEDAAKDYKVGTLTDGTLTVSPADISNATVFAITDRTYTGSPITPTPTVSLSYSYTKDGKTNSSSAQLTKDTDYTLSYANNTQVGQATITIKGTGNFTGTKTVNFNIKSASSTSGSSTTSSTTSSTSATPSTADPTSVSGIGSLLASGIAALGAARFARKRKN